MYFSTRSALAAGLLLASGVSAYPPPSIPALYPPPVTRNTDCNTSGQSKQRADAVKQAFQIAWAGYAKYALPGSHDELHPVDNTYGDPRNAWGASAVDALSTAVIMELPDIVETILKHIETIDYSKTATEVSLFETTIRYLAGMLSAHDLLTGPYPHLVSDAAGVEALKTQSKNLADNLKFAFNTTTGIPYNNLNLEVKTSTDTTNGLATVGTLILEWLRLSDLLGDPTYGDLAAKGESYLINAKYKSGLSSPWPGLLGTNIDIGTGLFQDQSGGWVGGDDSYYEYLIKMFVYDSEKFGSYRDEWIKAADSSMAHLASHPSTMPNLTFLATFDGQKLGYNSQHLACFDGGNFILAGLVLGQKKYVDFGLNLTASCHQTYATQYTHIGPDSFAWIPTPTTDNPTVVTPSLTPSNAAFYAKNGFYNTNGGYYLRPEVLESYYYAYRATGDQKYRDWSWDAFVAINATCHVGSGYSEIYDVNQANGAKFLNVQDSFFFAEVLKYAYAIQAPDNEWQVARPGSKNKWVFNTEAHPVKVHGKPV